jgi:hypothetical protein
MVVVPDLGKSLIMPSVTVQIPMPSGAIAPALAAPAQAASLIMPPVTANIQMPLGAATPARAAAAPSAQSAATDSSPTARSKAL